MFYKMIKIVFLMIIFINFTVFISYSQENNQVIKVKVSKITVEGDAVPEIYINGNKYLIKENDEILPDSQIITKDNQKIELAFTKGDKVHSFIIIRENTDFKYGIDDGNNINLFVKFGGLRGVVSKDEILFFNTETVKSKIGPSDFGIITKLDDDGKRTGYFIVFNGELTVESMNDPKNTEIVRMYERCNFIDYSVLKPVNFAETDFVSWKSKMLLSDSRIPDSKDKTLETLNYSDYLKKEEVKEEIKEEPEEAKKEEPVEEKKEKEDKNKLYPKEQIFSKLVSFKLSGIANNENIGVKFVFNPDIELSPRFGFGFYIPVYLIPYNILNDNRFFKINGNNNELSFGTDQNNNIYRMIFDISIDTFLKINKFRINQKEDKISFLYGDVHNTSDFLEYSMLDYYSPVFYPFYRKSSAKLKFNYRCFEGFVYAEDIIPDGLYAADLMVKTFYSSFRFRFRVSAIVDFYNFVKFESDESIFPAQFNTSLAFDAFDVDYMRFTLFANGGMLIPFTRNLYAGSSLFQDALAQNPNIIYNNFSASTGFLFRIRRFSFTGEFIFDSGLNKVGMFDDMYFIKRDIMDDRIINWLDDLSVRESNINDYNFGFRVTFKVDTVKYFEMHLSYQLTFPKYYDKLFFKLSIDTADKLKVRLEFFTLVEIISFISTVSDIYNLRSNSLLYLGFNISPKTGIDIELKAGMYPYVFDSSIPWHKAFMFDCGVVIKPMQIYQNSKKKNNE